MTMELGTKPLKLLKWPPWAMHHTMAIVTVTMDEVARGGAPSRWGGEGAGVHKLYTK